MKSNDNIEKLFKDTFKDFETDVNPHVWNNIQSGLQSATGSAAATSAKFALGKIIAGIVAVAAVSGSIWYFTSSDRSEAHLPKPHSSTNEIGTPESVTASTTEDQQHPTETKPENNSTSAWQAPPSVRTLNQQPNENIGQTSGTTKPNNDAIVASDVSSLDNTPGTSRPAGKYGNATQGDGGMIRGTHSATTSTTNANQGDSQEENPDAPTAVIFVNTSSGDAPLTVDFISQGVASSLSWDFGDGSISKENAPTHIFEKPGNYTVKLTAKNSWGTVSDKVNIEVKGVSSITNIPNIFTPNGDGENDYFFFEMNNVVSVGVAIYSQKEGKQVCTWNNIDGKWDGKLANGQNAPEGVYLYSIQANGIDGIVHTKKGVITLSVRR